MDGQRRTLVVRWWMLDGCALSLMKTLHLDIFSGISGDMFIGALLDLGVDAHQLEHELAKLELDGFHLHVSRQERGGIAGTKFDVHLSDHVQAQHYEHGHGHEHKHGEDKHFHDHARNFSEIKQLITASKLSAWVKDKAVAVFLRIAVAEGKFTATRRSRFTFMKSARLIPSSISWARASRSKCSAGRAWSLPLRWKAPVR